MIEPLLSLHKRTLREFLFFQRKSKKTVKKKRKKTHRLLPYHEAGYEKQVGSEEGERNTSQYNEQAFLASAKTMLYLIRRPPKHTEALVRAHFRQRGNAVLAVGAALDRRKKNPTIERTHHHPYTILIERASDITRARVDVCFVVRPSAAACEAYLGGCPVGAYAAPSRENDAAGCSAQRNGSSNTSPPSAGFKLMLAKLVPKLRAAFEDNARAAEGGG